MRPLGLKRTMSEGKIVPISLLQPREVLFGPQLPGPQHQPMFLGCRRSDIFVVPFSSRNRRGANFYPILPFPKKERRVLLTSTAFFFFMRNWTYIFSCHSCVIYRDYKSMEGGNGIRHSVALIMGDCTSWQTINCLVKR